MSETNTLKGRDRATVRACNLNPAMWRVPTIPVSNGHEVRGIFGMYPAKGVSSVVPRPDAYSSPAFPGAFNDEAIVGVISFLGKIRAPSGFPDLTLSRLGATARSV